jgi:hypothetical protein
MAQPSRVKEKITEMILATDKDDDANANNGRPYYQSSAGAVERVVKKLITFLFFFLNFPAVFSFS